MVAVVSIEFFHQRAGQPRARCVCDGDECAKDEVFACRNGETGKAAEKAAQMGWEQVKGKLFCPSCKANRKVVQMSQKAPPPSPSEEPPRQPTREQRRLIMTELTECYDTEAGRYIGDATDDQVAVLLDVMPGWVAEMRRDCFGDDGSNEAMEVTADAIEAEVGKLQTVMRECEQATTDARVAIRKAQELADQVKAIRKAVGPRVMKAVSA